MGRWSRLVRLALAGAFLSLAAGPGSGCGASGAVDSPPPADPEAPAGAGEMVPSAAVERLKRLLPSPEAAASEVLALVQAGDAGALRDLALSEPEFRDVVYPALPASRPGRNTSAEFLWSLMRQRSANSLALTVDRYRGRRLELVEVDFAGETTDYGPFRVHRETVLTVRQEDGSPAVVRLFGSMIEQKGGFKVFSFVID